MMSRKYTSKPISLPVIVRGRPFKHADLDFFNVDHSGASYEGRVFFNNPAADESTAMTPENGYAGAFHIFGHGGCFGDVGHCDITERRAFDTRFPHPLRPTEVSVDVTTALRTAAGKRGPVTITVVPIILSATDKCDLEDCFHFDGFRLQLRNPHGEEISVPVELRVAGVAPSAIPALASIQVAQPLSVATPKVALQKAIRTLQARTKRKRRVSGSKSKRSKKPIR